MAVGALSGARSGVLSGARSGARLVRVAVGQPLMMLDFRPAREDHQLLMCVDGIKSRETVT